MIGTMKKKSSERYVIIRSANAGCFAGILESRDADSVVLHNSRRLWYWAGAASLSELAVSGPSRPKKCKFSEPVQTHEILGVIEILDVTETARLSIERVPIWRSDSGYGYGDGSGSGSGYDYGDGRG